MNKKLVISLAITLFLTGCAAFVARAPYIQSQNNDGSTDYRVLIGGPVSQAAALGEEEAKKHCLSKGLVSQITDNYKDGYYSRISFKCWDMNIVRKLRDTEARDRSQNPTNSQDKSKVCVLMPVGGLLVNVCN